MKKLFKLIVLVGLITPLLSEPVEAVQSELGRRQREEDDQTPNSVQHQQVNRANVMSGAFMARAMEFMDNRASSVVALTTSRRILNAVAPRFGLRAISSKKLRVAARADAFIWTYDLKLYNPTDADLEIIARRCFQLRSLHLQQPGFFGPRQAITPEGLTFIAQLPSLGELNITNTNIDDTRLETIVGGCPNLKVLILGWCAGVSAEGLAAVAQLRYLEELDLRKTNITDADVQTIVEGCPNLKKLNLNECQITDAALQTIARNCPYLKTLVLCGCRNISDAGVQAITEGCPSLTTLDLSECLQLINPTIQSDSITALNLKFTRITDAAVQVITQNCPNLTTLDLNYTIISDAGVQAIAQGCSKLEKIFLYGTNVSLNLKQELRNRGIEVVD